MSIYTAAYADVIVRVSVTHGVQNDVFDIRLFEDVAPVTVTNFLSYANDTTVDGGSFDKIFVHRHARNFVLQTGGYNYDPALGGFIYDIVSDTFSGGLQKVVTDPPIVNEFSLSNTEGTIAMAQRGGDSASANSQWFINLADNSASLDGANGYFTVFGRVMDDDMPVITSLRSHVPLNKTSIHPFFNELPLVDYTDGDPVDETHLIMFDSFDEILSISGDIDFRFIQTSTSEQYVVEITNLHDSAILIDAIGATAPLVAPFSIVPGSDTCSNTNLAVSTTCSLIVDYSPSVDGEYSDELLIESSSSGISYRLSIKGKSAAVLSTEIEQSLAAIDFGEIALDPNALVNQVVLHINNTGNLPLDITSVSLVGGEASEFELFDNCTRSPLEEETGFCVLPINFVPATLGNKNTILTIASNDPDEGILEIPLSGIASMDTDGVSEHVEDAVSPDADGNSDGLRDAEQSSVASLDGINGKYLSVVSRPGSSIRQATLTSDISTLPYPDDVQFEYGVLQFTLDDLSFLGNERVFLLIEEPVRLSSVYAFSGTLDDALPHWHDFSNKDGVGASLLGPVDITVHDGGVVTRSVLLLDIFDGGPGDADMSVNGTIDIRLGIEFAGESTDTASLHPILLLLLLMVATMRRQYCRIYGDTYVY